jgi:hypothetical protein
VATKERLAAMAASLCAVCAGAMVIKLVEADPSDGACRDPEACRHGEDNEIGPNRARR